MEIKKVVVIGSGTMGSGIAAHLCNANIPVTLLDLKTEISTTYDIHDVLVNHPCPLVSESGIKTKEELLEINSKTELNQDDIVVAIGIIINPIF